MYRATVYLVLAFVPFAHTTGFPEPPLPSSTVVLCAPGKCHIPTAPITPISSERQDRPTTPDRKPQ